MLKRTEAPYSSVTLEHVKRWWPKARAIKYENISGAPFLSSFYLFFFFYWVDNIYSHLPILSCAQKVLHLILAIAGFSYLQSCLAWFQQIPLALHLLTLWRILLPVAVRHVRCLDIIVEQSGSGVHDSICCSTYYVMFFLSRTCGHGDRLRSSCPLVNLWSRKRLGAGGRQLLSGWTVRQASRAFHVPQ